MTNVIIDSVLYSLSGTNAIVMGRSSPPSDWDLVIPNIITYLDTSYNVTKIADTAFAGLTNLKSISIPSSVTNCGQYAFSGCTSLRSIVLNSYLSNLGISFFGINNSNTSWTFNYSGAVPNGVCNGRTGVTSVTLGNSITSIGESAFNNCIGLTSINIPSLVTSIGNNAFNGCTGLTSIDLPISLVNIGNFAFSGCTGLKNIVIKSYLSNLVNAFNAVNNDDMSWTFDYSGNIPDGICNSRKVINVTIGNSITRIGDAAFAGCVDLSNITLPPSLKHVGHSAFASSGITSLVIPSTVESFGNYAFGGCNSLRYIDTKAYLPNLGIIFFGTNPNNSTFIFDYSGAITELA